MRIVVRRIRTITVIPMVTKRLIPDSWKENFSLKVSVSITTKRCFRLITSVTGLSFSLYHHFLSPMALVLKIKG